MSELFSKDYLKDLLSAEGLDDMLKTSAKEGLDSIAERILDGQDTGIPPVDKILSGSNGVVREIAQESLVKTSETASGQAERDLFSADYLKSVLESDSFTQYRDKKTGDNVLLQTMADKGQEKLLSSLSTDNTTNQRNDQQQSPIIAEVTEANDTLPIKHKKGDEKITRKVAKLLSKHPYLFPVAVVVLILIGIYIMDVYLNHYMR